MDRSDDVGLGSGFVNPWDLKQVEVDRQALVAKLGLKENQKAVVVGLDAGLAKDETNS